MAQNLIVDGKEYLASAELAQRFGYTPDYVSRLAREGKIVATNVNRKWFVDEESLDEFRRLASLGKEVRSTELKKQRKVERLIHSQDIKKDKESEGSHVHVALAQSLAVFMCGTFTGLLGWTAAGSDIGVQDLVHGLEESYTQITQAVIPNDNPFGIFAEWSVAAVSQKQIQVPSVSEVISDEHVPEVESLTASDETFVGFSDEVDITFEDDGTGVVRPVFKNRTDGPEYRVLQALDNETGG